MTSACYFLILHFKYLIFIHNNQCWSIHKYSFSWFDLKFYFLTVGKQKPLQQLCIKMFGFPLSLYYQIKNHRSVLGFSATMFASWCYSTGFRTQHFTVDCFSVFTGLHCLCLLRSTPPTQCCFNEKYLRVLKQDATEMLVVSLWVEGFGASNKNES